MPKQRSVQDLTVDELRWLLMEKRRAQRQERLNRYRRTGRVVNVVPDPAGGSLDHWQTDLVLDEQGEGAAPVPRSRPRRFLDYFLLVVEVAAVAGFLYLLYFGLSAVVEINREAVAQQVLPTLTPTPLIQAVVLPSGHTPPNSSGGSRFNDAEIPAHLRPLVQAFSNVPLPTPGPEQAIRLEIPAIEVNQQIVQGDGWEQLKQGVGQHPGTPNPGESGNLVLSAHNDIFGEIFRDLDRLKPGDKIIVYTTQRPYTYIVAETRIVEPTQVEVMAPTSQPTVTLISCYPYLVDNKRIAVLAQLSS
jgi:sortase A